MRKKSNEEMGEGETEQLLRYSVGQGQKPHWSRWSALAT